MKLRPALTIAQLLFAGICISGCVAQKPAPKAPVAVQTIPEAILPPGARSSASNAALQRAVATINVVGQPLVTNYLEWWQDMPTVPTVDGPLRLDYPQWVYVQRWSPGLRQWTNVWDGPMPASRKIDFISTAPLGVAPEYRFTTSFSNSR